MHKWTTIAAGLQVGLPWLVKIGGGFLKIYPRSVAFPLPNSPLLRMQYHLLRSLLRQHNLLVFHYKPGIIKHQWAALTRECFYPTIPRPIREPYNTTIIPIGDISSSALENAAGDRLPINNATVNSNNEHENFHDHGLKGSNTTQLQNNTGHNISFFEQTPRFRDITTTRRFLGLQFPLGVIGSCQWKSAESYLHLSKSR